jgi:hypothetical protein
MKASPVNSASVGNLSRLPSLYPFAATRARFNSHGVQGVSVKRLTIRAALHMRHPYWPIVPAALVPRGRVFHIGLRCE